MVDELVPTSAPVETTRLLNGAPSGLHTMNPTWPPDDSCCRPSVSFLNDRRKAVLSFALMDWSNRLQRRLADVPDDASPGDILEFGVEFRRGLKALADVRDLVARESQFFKIARERQFDVTKLSGAHQVAEIGDVEGLARSGCGLRRSGPLLRGGRQRQCAPADDGKSEGRMGAALDLQMMLLQIRRRFTAA